MWLQISMFVFNRWRVSIVVLQKNGACENESQRVLCCLRFVQHKCRNKCVCLVEMLIVACDHQLEDMLCSVSEMFLLGITKTRRTISHMMLFTFAFLACMRCLRYQKKYTSLSWNFLSDGLSVSTMGILRYEIATRSPLLRTTLMLCME